MTDRLKQIFLTVLLAVGRFGLNLIYFFHKAAPTRNRISFISRQNPEPSEDLTMLAAELKRQSPRTQIVIDCKMIDPGLPAKIRYLFYMITRQMHLFATSRVVILDGYCIAACMLHHKKRLKIVQMWHAMGAFKKFGYTSLGESEGRSKTLARGMRMHENYDVVFISSEACRAPMAASFGCDPGKLVVMPLPRTDALRDSEQIRENARRIHDRYPQLTGKQVILYAPTFRRAGDILPYAKELIDAVDYTRYCLVVKLHPLDGRRIIAKHAIIDEDFTSQEWLSAADSVVTDYSAFLYEAAVAGKALYRYVPDAESYDTQRGFLVNPEQELPFYCSGDAHEIVSAIETARCDRDAVRAFADKYVAPGENHTRRMAQYILDLQGAEAVR